MVVIMVFHKVGLNGLATVDGYKQIDWQLKYIKKRYDNPCNALAHHKIKGWY